MPEYMELALSDSSQVRRKLPEAPDTLDVREQTAFTWVSWAGTRDTLRCQHSVAFILSALGRNQERDADQARGRMDNPCFGNPRFGKRPPKA